MSEANKTPVKRFVTEYQTNRDEAVLKEIASRKRRRPLGIPGVRQPAVQG